MTERASEPLGYVVIEFNQASQMPNPNVGLLFDDREEAAMSAAQFRMKGSRLGRRETYAVAEVWPVEERS